MNAYPNPKLPNFIQIWIYRFSGQMGPLWSAAWPPASCRPGNATRQFPPWAEAAPLCKSALSTSVASLKWFLVESVQLPGGLQLCFLGRGCASPEKQFLLCSPCLGGSCAEGYQQQVRARGSGTLPYSLGWRKKCTKLIEVSIMLMWKKLLWLQRLPGSQYKWNPQAKYGGCWLRGSLRGHLSTESYGLYCSHLLSPQEYPSQLPELFHWLCWCPWTVTYHWNLKSQVAVSVGLKGVWGVFEEETGESHRKQVSD